MKDLTLDEEIRYDLLINQLNKAIKSKQTREVIISNLDGLIDLIIKNKEEEKNDRFSTKV